MAMVNASSNPSTPRMDAAMVVIHVFVSSVIFSRYLTPLRKPTSLAIRMKMKNTTPTTEGRTPKMGSTATNSAALVGTNRLDAKLSFSVTPQIFESWTQKIAHTCTLWANGRRWEQHEGLMDLNLTHDELQFRDELRTWLAANAPKDWSEHRDESLHTRFEFLKQWQRKLYDGGWAGVSWPREYGGRGAGLMQQVIFWQEMALA